MSNAKAGEKHPMFGKTGELNPMFGKKRYDEIRQKSRIKNQENQDLKELVDFSKKIEVFDTETGIKKFII